MGVLAGQCLRYRIVVANEGTGAAEAVRLFSAVVRSHTPIHHCDGRCRWQLEDGDGQTVQPAWARMPAQYAGGSIEMRFGNLDAGENRVLTFTTRVANILPNTDIYLQSRATWEAPSQATEERTAPTLHAVVEPDYDLALTGDTTQYGAIGETVTLAYTATNLGTSSWIGTVGAKDAVGDSADFAHFGFYLGDDESGPGQPLLRISPDRGKALPFKVRVKMPRPLGGLRVPVRPGDRLGLDVTATSDIKDENGEYPRFAIHTTVQVMGIRLDGGDDLQASPGETVRFAYTATNVGPKSLVVRLRVDVGEFEDVGISVDQDGDGTFDDGFLLVFFTEQGDVHPLPSLAAGQSMGFVLDARIPDDAEVGDQLALWAWPRLGVEENNLDVAREDGPTVTTDFRKSTATVIGARLEGLAFETEQARDANCDGDLADAADDGPTAEDSLDVGAGECLRYWITAAPVGLSADDVRITAHTPDNTRLTDCTGNCPYTVHDGAGYRVNLAADQVQVPQPDATGEIVVQLGHIVANEKRVLTFTVKIDND